MMRNLLLLAVLGSAFSAHAEGPAKAFRVSVEARDGTASIFASPTGTVWPGSAWSMRVEGVEGYELSLQITEAPAGKVRACGTFESKRGNMAPSLVLSLDEKATVTVGDLSLAITVSRDGS